MKSKTELQIEYAFLSWDYNFRSDIENALEDDYVTNPILYDESALKRVATLLLIAPNSSSEFVLWTVRSPSGVAP